MPARRTALQPPAETIRVVMVEPRSLLGGAVREVLQQEDGIEVVAQVRSADEALEIVDEVAPDVILMGGGDGSSAGSARRLHDGTPRTAFVVLGGTDDDASIVEAVAMGATGHVAEVAEPEELVDTIRRVADGEDQLRDELTGRPDLVGRIVDEVRSSLELEVPSQNPLTPREIEVLGLIASGLKNREIATALALSPQTVKNHVNAILHRLGVPNRTRAVMYAVRHGWLALSEVPEPGAGRTPTLRVVSSR